MRWSEKTTGCKVTFVVARKTSHFVKVFASPPLKFPFASVSPACQRHLACQLHSRSPSLPIPLASFVFIVSFQFLSHRHRACHSFDSDTPPHNSPRRRGLNFNTTPLPLTAMDFVWFRSPSSGFVPTFDLPVSPRASFPFILSDPFRFPSTRLSS